MKKTISKMISAQVSHTQAKERAVESAIAPINKKMPPFLPLNKNSFEPFYAQILVQLKEQIQSGALDVNDPLPSESDIARIFSVSRMTARHALQTLTNEGMVYRERGRGTFIAPAKVEKEITHLMGFSAQMSLLGLKASTQVLAKSTIQATPQLAASLALQEGDPVFRMRRLRLADEDPIALEEVWLPQTRFPGIEKTNFAHRSLYETLRDSYAAKVGSAKEILEARAATVEEARLLRAPARASLLVVSRTLLDIKGQPLEMAHSLYRGDRYRAMLTISAMQQ